MKSPAVAYLAAELRCWLAGRGSGKTVLALQFLAHGATRRKEPGIFVAFEETSQRIVANATSFGWNLEQ